MKILKQVGHQGDVQFYTVNGIPKDAKKLDKKQFIAASERSGSFHALFGNYDMYEVEDGFLIDAKEDCILNHSLKEHLNCSLDEVKVLPKKDHRTSTLKKGLYFAGIQNKFDPLSGLKEKVKD